MGSAWVAGADSTPFMLSLHSARNSSHAFLCRIDGNDAARLALRPLASVSASPSSPSPPGAPPPAPGPSAERAEALEANSKSETMSPAEAVLRCLSSAASMRWKTTLSIYAEAEGCDDGAQGGGWGGTLRGPFIGSPGLQFASGQECGRGGAGRGSAREMAGRGAPTCVRVALAVVLITSFRLTR